MLADAYRERYTRAILDRADLDAIGAELAAAGTTALLCVELEPAACHRSIAAQRIAERFGLELTHLRPAA